MKRRAFIGTLAASSVAPGVLECLAYRLDAHEGSVRDTGDSE